MKRAFVFAALMLLATPTAFAQDNQRLEGSEYLAASRCVALSNVRQLHEDGYDVTSLERLVRRYYSPVANAVAQTQANNIRRDGARAGDDAAKISELRARRDENCAGFVATGLVQAPAGAVAAS